MLNTPPPPPPVQPVQPVYPYGGYGGYQQYPNNYYAGQYPQGYGTYMGQPNPYMHNSYTQPMYQTNPSMPANYMTQTNTGYMNQSYQQQPPGGQPFNPYNSYKK